MKITEEVVKEHGLSPDEYGRIVSSLGREPNLLELGIFSVMWSEHCSYKSSRKHLKGFPTKGEFVLQGPGENAGIVDIGDGLAVAFKMESHNHPSFIEPYQGAATGVGGILRDIFTMGARPVASLNSLRFGSPDNARTKFLLEGVVSGIAGYGNCIGVPTVGGEVLFNASYNGNCLVNVMTAGLVKKDRIFRGKAAGLGNPVMYVGSKTGRDGIHGATMASDVFGEGGEERRPTVQVGDPFAEKLLLEACLELFRTDYVVGIQDMGAAGLTSSSVEMASRGSVGIELDMDMVPRREEGMTPYEIMLSESQERMLMVVRAGTEGFVKEIFRKWDLDAEVIGTVVEGNNIRIIERGRVAADIPVAFLTDDAPVYDRPISKPAGQDELNSLDISAIPEPKDYNGVLLRLLGSLNIASKGWIYRQFDHMVRTDTVVCPGSDAAVVRIKGTDKGLALTVDCNSRYCFLDPRAGARIAVAEAARNLVASGARPMALTDCLNFGNPERPEVMWQIVEAIEGIKEACIALNIPVVSGNVSLYNETSGTSVHPTPAIGMVGLIEKLDVHTRQWFLEEGGLIGVIGDSGPGLGGSEYLSVVHGLERGLPPALDLEREKAVQKACSQAIKAGIILSAHDVSDGGLAVALAEACLNPDGAVGARVDIGGALRPDDALFGEAQSRIVVSFHEDDLARMKEIAQGAGATFSVIGRVGGCSLQIGGLIDIALESAKDAWSGALDNYIRS
ncbi:MAG: phosphoribosylformylglycinamidine synthase II [Deltaproteobacteria bacterium GWC2_55_46]|nr:MAG: phosphoribosylformylglycinamidine synthase II [Deltaproteobacteria bacterium GWA2_55_82]OGQ63290.1 MAG: phosphoribosylformylglycinamidine synthase II [Deltaproteobacteria bacterium RIFCSPLOWO2_02_FULL_55_12]OIJ73126.1 MAG: phosphoribosylformylglycinamidine synthase II [Deltaproteobacteria bacterium GWC2_55_46]